MLKTLIGINVLLIALLVPTLNIADRLLSFCVLIIGIWWVFIFSTKTNNSFFLGLLSIVPFQVLNFLLNGHFVSEVLLFFSLFNVLLGLLLLILIKSRGKHVKTQEIILKRKEVYLEIKKSMGELVRDILLATPGILNTIKLKVVDSFKKGLVTKEKNQNRTPGYIILMKSIKIHTAILFFLQVLVLFICISGDMFLAGDSGIGFISLAGVLLFMNLGIINWFYSKESEKYLIKIKKILFILIFVHIMLVFITMNMAALAASSN